MSNFWVWQSKIIFTGGVCNLDCFYRSSVPHSYFRKGADEGGDIEHHEKYEEVTSNLVWNSWNVNLMKSPLSHFKPTIHNLKKCFIRLDQSFHC